MCPCCKATVKLTCTDESAQFSLFIFPCEQPTLGTYVVRQQSFEGREAKKKSNKWGTIGKGPLHRMISVFVWLDYSTGGSRGGLWSPPMEEFRVHFGWGIKPTDIEAPNFGGNFTSPTTGEAMPSLLCL